MARTAPLDAGRELIEAFRHNGQVSEYLVQSLPLALWQAAPQNGRGRTIAAIVAHMQSVRRMFARTGGARPGPPTLDRKRATPAQAILALRRSTDDLAGLFEDALREGRARVKGMPRRMVNMMIYLIEHDAHHRGQICWLARDLGHKFSADDIMRMWGWKAVP